MVSTRIIFILFSSIMLLMITHSSAQQSFLNTVCSNDKGNFTANSTYQTNLNTLLTALPSSNNSNGYGFYNSSSGQNPNRVHAIGHCRGDIAENDCRSCLNDSGVGLMALCPNQKEAIGWKDNCMLRYSNRSIYGVMETEPQFSLVNVQEVSADLAQEFINQLQKMLQSLTDQASSSGPLRKFSIGNTSTEAFRTVFGLAQCTPDLSAKDCSDCLQGAFGTYTEYTKIGGRLLCPSCNFGYEISRFIDPANVVPLPSSPGSPPGPSSTNTTIPRSEPKGKKSRTVVIVVVSIAASVVALIACICVLLRLRKRKIKLHTQLLPDQDEEIQTSEALQFDFDTIRVATDNFSVANKLGQGGFGSVYKGQLPNGEIIAVKRLSMNSGQGNKEFETEVLLVAKLQHRNLVRLLGFCMEGNEKVLIYEFVPNGSLDHTIFDSTKRAQLEWDKRYKIIVGISKGLLYLHEDSRLRIIHRDLKASNILIDEELNPKISDFGMARLFKIDQTQGDTSRIVGTYGYMSPEYAMHGHFSVKSDVYSFGVLLLEIISGQKNNCFRHGENVEDLLSYAWKSWKDGTASNLIDPTLTNGSRSEIMRCIHIGLLCVQENISNRPTMTSISVMLNSYSLALPLPSPPNLFMNTRSGADPLELNYSSMTEDQSQSQMSNNSVIYSSVKDDTTEVYPR